MAQTTYFALFGPVSRRLGLSPSLVLMLVLLVLLVMLVGIFLVVAGSSLWLLSLLWLWLTMSWR